tara:strand:+ start:946 stop:1383 length:438 start_codon:yes stop_codon:yes gene_type:complete
MKYLLSILCLFLFSCDSDDNTIDLGPCDAILGEWKKLTAFHDYDGECDIYDETEEVSYSSECPFSYIFGNNTIIENGCNYTSNGEYTCNQENIELCLGSPVSEEIISCHNGTLSVENEILIIILETDYDDDNDCEYKTTLTFERD